MKLSTLEFVRLLPQFMREDSAVIGLAAGVDSIVPELSASLAALSTWDQIDNMTEAELDALAWELNILWYNTGAGVDVKRELVKNSDKVYKRLGTKWAVENVIHSYFGAGTVEEWWEYGGDPGHFRILSNNPSLSAETMTEFVNILNKVKRASAKLDEIVIALSAELNLCAGIAIHESSVERYDIGATLA